MTEGIPETASAFQRVEWAGKCVCGGGGGEADLLLCVLRGQRSSPRISRVTRAFVGTKYSEVPGPACMCLGQPVVTLLPFHGSVVQHGPCEKLN